jgi:hypothetical protein
MQALFAALLFFPSLFAVAQTADVTYTIGTSGVAIQPLLGVNAGPLHWNGKLANKDLFSEYGQIGVKAVRSHDIPAALDIAVMYPDRSKDPTLQTSYNFSTGGACTAIGCNDFGSDAYVASLQRNGLQLYLRIWDTAGAVSAPTAAERPNWVKAAVEVVRHYQEGKWSGTTGLVNSVEIGNEPDSSAFWPSSYTKEEFYKLYSDTALALRAAFPTLKIGGPGITQSGFSNSAGQTWVRNFMDYVKASGAPLDFFSWHLYSNVPADYSTGAAFYRNELNSRGYGASEIHVTEWNTAIQHGSTDPLVLAANLEYRTKAKGAALNTMSWMYLQQNGIAKAYFYRGNNNSSTDLERYGLFAVDGSATRSALAFALWSEFSTYESRIDPTASATISGLKALAAQRSNGQVAILVANAGTTSANWSAGFTDSRLLSNYALSLSTVDDNNTQTVVSTPTGTVFSIAPNTVQMLVATPSASPIASTRTALFVNASTSTNKTSEILLINPGSVGATLTATAYSESGTLLGTAGTGLGSLAANQSLRFTSAQLESALGFVPGAPTAKYWVNFSANLSSFELVNYTRDIATGNLTVGQAQRADRSANPIAVGATRSAWFVSSSTSANKTNVLRIINTGSTAGTLTANAYDEAGNRYGSADVSLGAIAARQMLSYTSAQLETAMGFVPTAPTAKYRVVFSSTVPNIELVNFTKDIASGNLTLVQAQIDDRPVIASGSSSRNVLMLYPSTNTSRISTIRFVNPNVAAATLTATVYDEAGNVVVAGGSLGTAGGKQILVFESNLIESRLGYVPTSPDARYRMVVSANVPSFEVINNMKVPATGNLYLAQPQTDNRPASSATSTTRNAYSIYPSSAGNITSQLHVVNTTSQSTALSATAYDENGALLASGKALGTLGANQMLTFTSAQLEALIGFVPASSTSKWRIAITGALTGFELLHYAKDAASGLLVLMQAQTE